MTSRAARRREHQRFCEIEGWREVRNSRGTPTQHHITYELDLLDARILRTRISRPANADVYGTALWSHILSDQLDVTEVEFWQCVDQRVLPRRSSTSKIPETTTLPARIAYQLVHSLHMTNEQIAVLTLDDALALLTEYWAKSSK